MKVMKHKIIIVGIAFLAVVGCTRKDIYDETYDIQFKTAKVLSFSPTSAYLGDTIQLFGENLNDPTLKVFLGADSMPIIRSSATATSVKVIVPRNAEKNKIKAYTFFSADARVNQFTQAEFTPLYPATKITYIPDTLFATQPFTIQGENLDLITKVAIGDTILPVSGLGATSATFNFKNVKFTKPIATINFVTKNKDNFTDKQLVVFADLPKIIIMGQFPDTVGKNENLQLLFDPAENGQYITNVKFEYTYKDNRGKIKTGKLDAGYEVRTNKIYTTVPDTTLTGNVIVEGKYSLSATYKIVLKP
jgi:hypothetical protein